MLEPNFTIKDWETLYNMNKQLETKVIQLEVELAQLKERIPQTNLLSKHLWVRVLTVIIYVIIWQIVWTILLFPSLWVNWPIAIIIVIVMIVGLILRKTFNDWIKKPGESFPDMMHRLH